MVCIRSCDNYVTTTSCPTSIKLRHVFMRVCYYSYYSSTRVLVEYVHRLYLLVVEQLFSWFANRLATGVSRKSQLREDSFAMKAQGFGLDVFPEHRNETDPFDGHPLWRPHNEVAPCKDAALLREVPGELSWPAMQTCVL